MEIEVIFRRKKTSFLWSDIKDDTTLSDRTYLEIFSYLIFNKKVILTNIKEWLFFER